MRVLLIEDDRMIGAAVEQALKDAAYAVDWVTDGATAIHAAENEAYELALLDIWLELQGRDQSGRLIFWSGEVKDGGTGPVDETAHFYRSYQLDGDYVSALRVSKIDGGLKWRRLHQNAPDPNYFAGATLNYPEPWLYTKFSVPTIAGGKVFVPTASDKLLVYGLKR